MPKNDDELNDWGLAFVEALDRDFAGDEEYEGGDVEYIMQAIADKHPEITDAQYDWLEDYYGEA